MKQITEFYDQQKPERNHQLYKENIERELRLNADQETSIPSEVQTVLPLRAAFKRGTFYKEWEFYSTSDFQEKIPILGSLTHEALSLAGMSLYLL